MKRLVFQNKSSLLLKYHVRYLSTLLYKQIQQLGSYNPDPLHSRTAPFWHQNQLIHLSGRKAIPPPLNVDLVYLIQINSYFVLIKDVCQMKYTDLETRSHGVNMSFIIEVSFQIYLQFIFTQVYIKIIKRNIKTVTMWKCFVYPNIV